MCLTEHTEILHTSRQLHCRDLCKIPLWLVEYVLNQSSAKFDRISNSIEIPLVGRAPDLLLGYNVLTKMIPSLSYIPDFMIKCCFELSTKKDCSLQNKCRTMNPDGQNLDRSGKLSFFVIYKFWQNCALIQQASDLILKTGIEAWECSSGNARVAWSII